MNTGKTIKKILFISMWLVIGSGMVVLLAAAVRKQKNDRCHDYTITVKAKKGNFFVDKNDVEKLMIAATNSKIKGQALSSFNLRQLEELLEDNNWINDAQLYFDNRDVLHITVTGREPLARIFTTAGNSYYIDSSMARMPLSDKMSARVPVFTGFPEKKVMNGRDSTLLNSVKTIATFISNDNFWNSQVSQIDITPDRNFEMIPVVGIHTVELGDGNNIAEKFHRLFVFYDQVLSKTGFDKYKTIDVQYAGQVVGSKSPIGTNKIDSVQLRRNVEKLLKQAKDAQEDTTGIVQPLIINQTVDMTPITDTDFHVATDQPNTPVDTKGKSAKVAVKTSNPNPVKTGPLSHADNKPKAVMGKRN